MLTHSRCRLAALLLSTLLLLGACGDDSKDTAATEDKVPSTTTTPVSRGRNALTVTGSDYKFDGLPAEMAAGTMVEFANGSTKELHEFVAIRLPDSETRPVSELIKLPESETEAIFGSGPPAAVLLAPPGGAETITAVGDGTISDPGRYAVVCFIPTGADPAAYLAAMQNSPDGPPDVPGGPPHALNGMFAEVKVT